jgi:NAD-dependent DNA ligase
MKIELGTANFIISGLQGNDEQQKEIAFRRLHDEMWKPLCRRLRMVEGCDEQLSKEITQETCKQAGLGEKVTSNLLNWINLEYPEMKEFLPFSFKSSKVKPSNADNPTVCITGKLTSFKTKAEATKVLEAAGLIVVESVTKTLKYLIDEEDKGSTKRKKAEEYGVTIVTNLKDFVSKI